MYYKPIEKVRNKETRQKTQTAPFHTPEASTF